MTFAELIRRRTQAQTKLRPGQAKKALPKPGKKLQPEATTESKKTKAKAIESSAGGISANVDFAPSTTLSQFVGTLLRGKYDARTWAESIDKFYCSPLSALLDEELETLNRSIGEEATALGVKECDECNECEKNECE